MPRAKKNTDERKQYDESKAIISDEKVSDVLRTNFMPYAMSVIVSRAIPEIDGLKPSHRKLLYTMYKMGLLTGNRTKSANVASQTMLLNPHGDAANYETMVRMTDDNETFLTPLVDSKGNMGKHYSRDMAFSASRYCVTGNTLISTDRGLIPIKEIENVGKNKEKDIDISVKSMGGAINKASKIFNSGVHDTFRVILANGMSVEGTVNHPLLVLENGNRHEWKIIQDLKKGDVCVVDVDQTNPLFGNYDNLDEAKLLGILYSDTYIDSDVKNIKDFADDITMNAENRIFVFRNNKVKKSRKEVPPYVLQGTKEFQVEFLKNLFDLDGEIVEIGGNHCISMKSESRRFLAQLQVVLATNFGLYTEIGKVKGTQEYALTVPQHVIGFFRSAIGFISEDKNRALDELKLSFDENVINYLVSRYAYIPVKDIVPTGQKEVYSVKVESECHSFSANGFINHNTEAKLSKVAEEFFKGINKNTVDFVDNYDATSKEPVLLPVTFPNILANPTQGIAVGMASNIPSFNLKELCDAAIMRIQKPKGDILTVMQGPDFTTGGYILYEDDVMRQIYNTGKGAIRLRAKYKVDKKNSVIEITEIPFSTTAEAIIEGIVDLIKKGKIKEINDVRDEIDKNGFKIAIDYKRTSDPDILMKKLFKATKLEDFFSCNFNVLIDGYPRTIGVYEILDEWIKWRRTCVKRETEFDLAKEEKELHLLRGLEKILLNINKAIKIIRETEKDEDVVPSLMAGFKIDEAQANYVADIKLRNLNKEYLINKTKNIADLEKDIERLKGVIGSEKEIDKIIVKTLQEIAKKYGKPRKTEIIPYEENTITVDHIIEDYPIKICRTKEGYIKKLAMSSLKNSPELKVKDEDEIVQEYETTNKTEIIFFTNKCNVYKVYAYSLRDCKPSEFGEYINNILEMDRDEDVIYMCPINCGENVLMGFENGKVAKFPLSSYETKNNRKKLINAFYSGSKVLDIYITDRDKEFGMTNSRGKLLVFNTKDIPLKALKTTQGIQVIRLAGKAVATSFKPVEEYNLESKVGFGYKTLPAAGGKYSL